MQCANSHENTFGKEKFEYFSVQSNVILIMRLLQEIVHQTSGSSLDVCISISSSVLVATKVIRKQSQ